jgi:hypothetical protein
MPTKRSKDTHSVWSHAERPKYHCKFPIELWYEHYIKEIKCTSVVHAVCVHKKNLYLSI